MTPAFSTTLNGDDSNLEHKRSFVFLWIDLELFLEFLCICKDFGSVRAGVGDGRVFLHTIL